MESGILYVVFNKTIRDFETNEYLYKIGITKNTVTERYYDFDLKMPGKIETLFAYRLEDYKKAELAIHSILHKYHEKGEWFNLTEKELNHIKATCELMGGRLVTDELEKGTKTENGNKPPENSGTNIESSSNLLNIPNLTNTVDIKILESILKRGTLHVNDPICFQTTVDVLNSLFGKKHRQGFAAWGKSVFWTKERDKYIWFAPIDQKHKGWTNIMPDENNVHQMKIDGSPFLKDDNPKPHAIFAKKYEFRFVGIFIVEKHEKNVCVHKRISEELHLQEWDIK
jgi:hypothetical protein